MLTNAQTGVAKTMLKEENPYYIDINNNLTFLNDGQFVWTSKTVTTISTFMMLRERWSIKLLPANGMSQDLWR